MAVVWIPSLLRSLTAGQEKISVPGSTVGQVMDALEQIHPGLRARLFQGDRLRPNLSMVVDGEMSARGLLQPVNEGSEIRFIPAIRGGSSVGTFTAYGTPDRSVLAETL